jgi:MYXO-CTERM domain-containing protein
MRRFLAVSLIFVAFTLALTMMFSPGAAQASPAAPSHLLAGPSPTPTLPPFKLPPAGVLVPTPEAVPSTNPVAGGDQPDTAAPQLIGLGGMLVLGGLFLRSRRRRTA